jgi:hypothetical protein
MFLFLIPFLALRGKLFSAEADHVLTRKSSVNYPYCNSE